MTNEEFKKLKIGDKVITSNLSQYEAMSYQRGTIKALSPITPAATISCARIQYDWPKMGLDNIILDRAWHRSEDIELIDNRPLPLPG
jgi:hypothetical protein